MTSREQILADIKKNKPANSPLPEIPLFLREEMDLLQSFKEVISFVGGNTVEVGHGKDINELVKEYFTLTPEFQICTNVNDITIANFDLAAISDPHDLEKIDLAIIKGEFGVAENGAVWIPSSSLAFRAIPFITQYMIIVLDKKEMVWNMHQAFERLNIGNAGGYGCFISGPSKTADIEQSLVVGAHGAKSLHVFLV